MRVLLCGSNYASSYLEPLWRQPSGMQLAGILSRGSARSHALARQAGVPSFTALDQLPADLEAAVVAVPGQAGIDLILGLLERGLHVLAEHPLGGETIEQALALATERGRVFHINSHYADLEPIAPFVDHARELRTRVPLLFVNASFNPRTAFSVLELLARVLGGLEPFEIAKPAAGPAGSAFAAMPAMLAGIPALLCCQRVVSAFDDGSATLVSHQVTAGFGTGCLQLGDTFGPVMWVTRVGPAIPGYLPTWSALGPPPTVVSGGHGAIRSAANLLALHRFAAHIRTGVTPPMQQPAHLLGVGRAWLATFEALGETVVGGY